MPACCVLAGLSKIAKYCLRIPTVQCSKKKSIGNVHFTFLLPKKEKTCDFIMFEKSFLKCIEANNEVYQSK